MQSCRLIPGLLLPPADPAGAKPQRDHRFLDRVSRHEVPKTPGNDDAFKVYDPARVSHIPVSQSVRHPSGVAGSLATPDPRVVGATPLDPGLKSGHPCRGASPTYPLLAPTGGAPLAGARSIGIGHPRSGDRCIAPHLSTTTPQGVAELSSPSRRPLAGSRHIASAYTSVIGTSCLDRCLWSGHPCGCRRAGEGAGVRLVRLVR